MKISFWYCLATVLIIGMLGDLTAFSKTSSPDYQEQKTVEYIVISARGTSSSISQTPGGVGFVDKDKVSEDQPTSITNIMRSIPGVEKSSDSAWGSDINIRGLGRNSVVFLIDGCRINTATDINAQFGLVNPLEIDRIEVLKGPISALYGSGSIGGVVSAVTKKGYFADTPQWHGETDLTYTDNPKGVGTYTNISFNSPDYWVFVSGSYRDNDSYEAGDGYEIANSQFRDNNEKVAAGVKLNSMNIIELQGQYAEAINVGIPGKGLSLPSGPDVTYPETSLALISLTHTFSPKGDIFKESRANLFYQKIERQVKIDNFFENSSLIKNISGADHETWGVKWQTLFDFGTHVLVAGTDLWNWKIDDSERYKIMKNGSTGVDSPLGEVEQFSGGFFAEDDWKLADACTLNIGGRIDYIGAKSNDLYNWIEPPSLSVPVLLQRESSDYNDLSWNAHAGLTWNFIPKWSMTFLSASSYRAPDLMDRFKYINLGGGVELFGNPKLNPERSIFFEYGLNYNSSNLKCTTQLYTNHLKDLISEKLINDNDMAYSMQNVDKAHIYGAEFDAEWFFMPKLALYTNIALTEGKNTSTEENLPFIPPLNGLLGVRYDCNTGFWTTIEIEWAASQRDIPLDGMESKSWETVNLRAGYRFLAGKTRHEIMAGVDNLLDKDYRNYLSTSRDIELKEPGIGFLAAWKMQF